MGKGDLYLFLYAAGMGLPLSVLLWNLQRMRGRARNIVFVAEDLVQLLGEGEFARAVSRLEEVGGSMGRDVQELLHRLLQQPWVGAGEAVRIADDHVAPRGGSPLGVVACLAIPLGIFVSLATRDRLTEHGGGAVLVLGLVSFGVMLALPFCADHFKLRIIRAIHEVQRAAEKWLAKHREPGPRI